MKESNNTNYCTPYRFNIKFRSSFAYCTESSLKSLHLMGKGYAAPAHQARDTKLWDEILMVCNCINKFWIVRSFYSFSVSLVSFLSPALLRFGQKVMCLPFVFSNKSLNHRFETHLELHSINRIPDRLLSANSHLYLLKIFLVSYIYECMYEWHSTMLAGVYRFIFLLISPFPHFPMHISSIEVKAGTEHMAMTKMVMISAIIPVCESVDTRH